MVKGIIYDLDDLMVNSFFVHEKAWNILFAKYGHRIQDLPAETHATYVGWRISEILKELIKYFNLKVDYKTLYQKRQEIFLELVKKELPLMPGLMESLNLFKDNGLKIGLASSGTRPYIDLVLTKYKLHNYFDITVTGDDVFKGKPDPEIYSQACQKLGLKPDRCVVLEDAYNGIAAAKSAGCKCIAIVNNLTPPQKRADADLVLNSLLELTMEKIQSLPEKNQKI
jgi:HAD superfamily hydrolase (TIGR01509 family)